MLDWFPLERKKKERRLRPLGSLEIAEIEDQILELPNLVKTGFITGRQVLMTPKRASIQVRSAMREYCFWAFWP